MTWLISNKICVISIVFCYICIPQFIVRNMTQSVSYFALLNLNLNSLLVKRQIDNPSPGAVTGGN